MTEEIEASIVEANNLAVETFQLSKRRNWWNKFDVGDEVTKNIKSLKNILGLLMAGIGASSQEWSFQKGGVRPGY